VNNATNAIKKGRIEDGPVFDFFERSIHPGYDLLYSWHESFEPPFERHYLMWRCNIAGREYHNAVDISPPATIDKLMVAAERLGEDAQQHWEIMQMTPEQRERLRQMYISPTDESKPSVIVSSRQARYKRARIIPTEAD
jgi:hypothetical protein